jgi:hypothetical protein
MWKKELFWNWIQIRLTIILNLLDLDVCLTEGQIEHIDLYNENHFHQLISL